MLYIGIAVQLNAQCTDGSQPECQCSTAPVLCTIDSLDGYMFSMDAFLHPQDGPSPLCPGPGCGCVPHNPTWFAFTAWCTSLDLNVQFSNCVEVNGNIGVQVAIYENCTSFTPIDCNVSSADCGNTNDKMLNLTGLNIGRTYYFLIDGCAGSYCDVTIDVLGSCGLPTIDPWTNPISGNDRVCAGDTETYTVDDLGGANTFHWYVDGVEVGTSSDPFFDINWPNEGTFELCVDASNDPCIPVTESPVSICMTIDVYDPEAGMITAVPNPLCPGETTDISVSGFNTNPDLSQYLIIVDPNNIVFDVINGATTSFSYDQCGTFTVYSYNFITADNPSLPVIGQTYQPIDCTTDCCEIESLDVIFEDTEAPTFINPPADETLECIGAIPSANDLEVQDNCLPNAFITPTDAGSPDLCSGGTLTRTWEFTDSCGNVGTHIQTFTVDPIAAPVFSNPPADITVDCNNIPVNFNDLTYDNGASDPACQIMGNAAPVINGPLDICSGSATINWTYTDTCGRTISHDQIITITPPSEPSFVNPPADMIVSCANMPTMPPADLDYTNNESGNCEISGSVAATVSGTADECGGTISYTWEYTDTCSRTIMHTQNITVDPAPQANFIDPPSDTIMECDALPLPSPPDLDYTNGETGSCEISGVISPTVTGNPDECGGTVTYVWEFTDACGRPISHIQTITINPAPEAAFSNLPADTTVNCDYLPLPAPPDLMYDNGASGLCAISGSVSPGINGNPDECGGSISYSWQFTDICGRTISHTQTITVNPTAVAAFVNPPGPATLTCDEVESGNIPNLDYTNSESGICEISGSVPGSLIGTLDYCGGNLAYEWTFTDNCNRIISHSQTINVDPAPPASFMNPPADITITCAQANNLTIPSLSYDNGLSGSCEISGMVNGNQTGTYNACGGTLTQSWEFTDNCGRTINESRSIVVTPAPPANWVNPPVDITVDCDEVGSISNDISYDNQAPMFCNTAGTIPGVITGSYDACGGILTQEWSFMDPCGNSIAHQRTITVNPAPTPAFVDPPADVTLDCGETFPNPMDLTYTNGGSGQCEISGTATPSVNSSGNIATFTWEFTDPCSGNLITHTQMLTLTPTPDLTLDPEEITVCDGAVFDLNNIVITDLSNTNPDINFYEGFPPGPGNLISDLNYTVNGNTTIYIIGSLSPECSDTVEFNFITQTPPNAGMDGTGEACDNSTDVSLFNFLTPPYENNGSWSSPHSGSIDISDPNAVNFTTVSPGDYLFYYIVPGTAICPPDTADIVVSVMERPYVILQSIECSADNSTYVVIVEVTNNGIIYPSAGTVTDNGDGTFTISGIPIDDDLTIDASLQNGMCFTTTNFSAPDCDCPNVPLPDAPPPTIICEGDMIPELSVNLGADYSANWFDQATGGTLLASGTSTYTPAVSAPGIYSFFVQAYSLADSCLSSGKAEVILEIRALPNPNGITIQACGQNGIASFDLVLYIDSITGNPANSVDFYISLADANSDENSLSSPFENTIANDQTIYIRVTSSNNCEKIDSIDLLVNDSPVLTVDAENESCVNASDGSFDVSVNGGSSPFNYFLNGQDEVNPPVDSLGNGVYVLEVQDANSCSDMDTFTIEEGQEIDFEIVSIVCDDNGTSTDSTDDRYIIHIFINSGLGGNYSFNSSDTNITNLPYGDTLVINIAARTSDFIFTIIDELENCETEGVISDLGHCSSDCSLDIQSLEYSCNNNGTSTDPTDDFYEFLIIVNGTNTGSNGQFTLRANGMLINNFNYGDSVTFTLPANGNPAQLTISDSQITACRLNESTDALTSCSDECIILTEIIEINCDDEGTQNDDTDDTYTVLVYIDGVNTGNSGWSSSLQNGNYGDTILFGPFLISNGDQTFQFTDVEKNTCIAELDVSAPSPCSQPCELSVYYEILSCNNNMTGNDTTDDYFDLRIAVIGIQGPVTRYSVSNQDLGSFGPFDYGDTVTINNVPANGENYIFEIIDDISGQCSEEIAGSLGHCSSCPYQVTAGNNATISCSQNTVWVSAEAIDANSISWSGPGGFMANGDSVEVDAPGTYVVTAAFDDNCTASDSLQVGLDNDIPVATAGPDGLINCVTDSFVLENLSNNNDPDIIVEWLDENGMIISTDDRTVVRDSGTYRLRLIDTVSQCTSAVDRVIVSVNKHDPLAIIYAHPDSTFNCSVRCIILSTDQEENTTYFWSSDDFSNYALSITVTESGTYRLIALDTISNCADTNNILIDSFTDYPSISILPPDTLNCNNSEVLLDASGSYLADSIQYQWMDAQGNILAIDSSKLSVSNSGYYIFRSEDISNGCVNSDTVWVPIDTSSLQLQILGETDLSCGVDSTYLSVEEINGNDFEVGLWSTDSGTIITGNQSTSILVIGEANYTVTGVHPTSGCVSEETVFVNTSGDLSVSSLSVDSILCQGDKGAIAVNAVNGTPPYDIRINDDPVELGERLTGLDPGTYQLSVVDDNGCTFEQTIIFSNGRSVQIDLDPLIRLTQGDSTVVEAIVNLMQNEIDSIVWEPADQLSCSSCLRTVVTALNSEVFQITITDINGCSGTASFQMIVLEPAINIYIPNTISPNRDGLNDGFTLFTDEEIVIESMLIFDRWGNQMVEIRDFLPNEPALGWDGTFKSKSVNPGVYVYMINYILPNGEKRVVSGDVTVLK